jgi:hypothetical protein
MADKLQAHLEEDDVVPEEEEVDDNTAPLTVTIIDPALAKAKSTTGKGKASPAAVGTPKVVPAIVIKAKVTTRQGGK